MIIKDLSARTILASMGNKTVEVQLTSGDGKLTTCSIPAGLSAGKYEVTKVSPDLAVTQINSLTNDLINRDWQQATLDEYLLTKNIGGNATLPISTAFFKAEVSLKNSPPKKFPKLLLLLFEGGEHGSKNIAIQEFLLVENSVTGAKSDFTKVKDHLTSLGLSTTVGAEGGFSPSQLDDTKILQIISKLFPNGSIALDVAGSFQTNALNLPELLSNFPIVSLEDPFSDEAWDQWTEFNRTFGSKIMIVGDDLTATNPERIKKAINDKAVNAVVIKPNQNGTVSGALAAAKLAQSAGFKIIVSHRGEETDDDWIVDFALSSNADYVKFGGLTKGERIAKYNRLLELGME